VWFAACRGGLAWLVERLLDTGAAAAIDRRVHGNTGETGLMAAAAAGRGEVAALLVRRGATLDAGSFRAAAEGGLLEIVREHLERGLDVDSAFYGRTPLAAAIAGGHVEVARLLLDRGADPAALLYGRGHLHRAAEVGVPALVDLLLERHPDRSAALRHRDDHGWTPLFAAVWYGHRAAAERLIAAGAEVDLVDESERSLLELARERGLDLEAASRPRSGDDSEAGQKPR
jgi:ankyrin repeat protein